MTRARSASRYFRTPKGTLLLILGALLVISGVHAGLALVAPVIAGAIIPAALLDLLLLRWRKQRWVIPDGALLTGMIVAMILAPQEPSHVAAITACIAVGAKYLLRTSKANVFNPAALGLVATFYLFGTGQSWWGALPELPTFAIALLFAAGVFITVRVNKIPAMLSFLGVYYLLVTIAAFAGDPARVAELYRTPDLHAALFFAFFMITDPPTSPPRGREQVIFGAIAAVVGFAVFELVGAAYYLLAGLLVANAHEAWRRTTHHPHRSTA